MDAPTLLARLDEIAAALERTGRGVALLGLGSVGTELERVDAYSDLDFFAIVEPGSKQALLTDLSWLASVADVAFHFRNTADGYKLLYADGVFCEFAVFEPGELAGIPFAAGRVVWAKDGLDPSSLAPAQVPAARLADVEWQLGEVLTNLFVGLGRFWRGERLAAARLVQGSAVDRVLELTSSIGQGTDSPRDPFAVERRAEQRLPLVAPHLAEFVQGYDRTPESARAILAFLTTHFTLDQAITSAVRRLCEPPAASEREEA